MLTEEQVKKAVDWWAEAIQNPKFDNGDTIENAFLGAAMATMATEPVTKKQIEIFKAALRKILEDREYIHTFGLFTDYGPDENLADALNAAGISHNNVPWKTSMIFRKDKVIVSYGYGAPYKEI